MATHDYDIANQSGAAFRTDLNNALAAIQSNNSNSSSPATTVAYQWWADTTTGTLKIRNSANNAWVELLQLDGTLTLEDGSASTPALAFRDDLNTGIFSSAADTFNVATGGVERMELGATTIFNEDGADVDFRIEGDTDANLFHVDAGNNRVGISTSTPQAIFSIQGAQNSTLLHLNDSSESGHRQFTITSSDNGLTYTLNSQGSSGGVSGEIAFACQGSEVARFDETGRFGIGATSFNDAAEYLLVKNDSTAANVSIVASNDAHSSLNLGDEDDFNIQKIKSDHTDNSLQFFTNNSEHMRITSDGRILIGITSADNNFGGLSPDFQIEGTTTNQASIALHKNSNDAQAAFFCLSKSRGTSNGSDTIVQDGDELGTITFTGADGTDRFRGGAKIVGRAEGSQAENNMPARLEFFTNSGSTDPTEKMRITSAGNVGIGTSSPVNKLEVDNGSNVCFARISTTNTGSGVAGLIIANSSKTAYNDGIKIKHGAGVGLVTGLDDFSICRFSPNNGASGNFHVFGALSKGSGSFLIDHPLESKKDTHNLVHSFIEGPQADLIYRGKIALTDGSATVNIDTVSGMTSGTFATLNTNVQCFTNNETGWSAVKGSVSGNILTITAEDNSCSDTISWLVIGERQDQHMKETTWTDNDGKVIVEPLKA